MAATVTLATMGRGQAYSGLVYIPFTVAGNSAVYATASGGLPIDLTPILSNPGFLPEFSQSYVNPSDIVGIYAPNRSTNGYIAMDFALGTPTYQTATFPFEPGGAGQTVRPAQQLATCPATFRFIGIGPSNANHAAFGEVADGANTDSITMYLAVCPGGPNS